MACIVQNPILYSGASASVVFGVDNVPSSFNLGADQTDLNNGQYYYSSTITIAGMDTGATTTAVLSDTTNFATSLNGGAYSSTNKTVSNGSTLTVRGTSSASFNSTRTVTLTINGPTDSWSLTTGNPGYRGQLQATNPISFNDLRAVYGPASATAVSLYDYRRGGPYVGSDATGVPTGNPISLTHFLGAQYRWTVTPLVGGTGTAPSGFPATFQWSTSSIQGQLLEYYWTVTGEMTGVTIVGTANAWTTSATPTIGVSFNGVNAQRSVTCTLSIRDPISLISVSTSASCDLICGTPV
jgi:hypothetical protein